ARACGAGGSDLACEIADAGFASVVTNYFEDAFIREIKLLELETVAFSLFRHEVSFCNLEFFAFRITGETEYLETILKRGRNRMQHVCRGDEEYFREIVFDVEITLLQRVVLFRIEHLEQRRTRVAAEVCAELVDFIEQQHRIHSARLLHHLNDLTGQRADVGTAMT